MRVEQQHYWFPPTARLPARPQDGKPLGVEHYWGVFIAGESTARGKDRVNIKKFDPASGDLSGARAGGALFVCLGKRRRPGASWPVGVSVCAAGLHTTAQAAASPVSYDVRGSAPCASGTLAPTPAQLDRTPTTRTT